ncbi:type I restriction-modification enzyme R subunit C-terminal domain-containing protein [Halomonas ramblicola]|uniref:type I restriction endonuclease subunit R n=1 Tax=Halomonas ramblicola TaxID=747349 RepID=UPI0025B4CB56|nr:DEAD/DEAH box helicase family protein [Halomonas ramblicola]MDN3521870.1 type I restriction-modification enzyme R subunit C-terminal domain-containing protein [Halomonas ramblicola]
MRNNQNPEQRARDRIDDQLRSSGWVVQSLAELNPSAARGVAVREYPTETGPMDYLLLVDGEAVGLIEAKREEEGHRISTVEEQSARYADAHLKHIGKVDLRFVYEATGEITRFTDRHDPAPRAREVFQFHRPETLTVWRSQPAPFRKRLQALTVLQPDGLRDCQFHAIGNLETSLKENRPRALIQMATGAGKTFTAITSIYRLLKHAGAKRVLFLVDTRNLGVQAENEFHQYLPQDDNRKFTELYTVQRLRSPHVPSDGQVCICTIQRLYSILKGEPLPEEAEDEPAGLDALRKEPLPVVYNAKVPPEFFDVIVIDECHRSIYNLWRQVIEYFDSFLVGLTATPDNRTFGFFQQNVVSEYPLEQSVVDGVNVDHFVWRIDTRLTREGATIEAEETVEHRDRLTREQRWSQLDEDLEYAGSQLDRSVVNPNQIRTVIRAFRDALPRMFPERRLPAGEGGDGINTGGVEVPKTLIFAKTDSHADDIIKIVREEFAAGNDFCKKITYRIDEDPQGLLNSFRNDYHPRIAVTVDMIATGTDVKPLECLLFMRDVKSRNYYMQMVGRGTRSLDADGLRQVNRSASGPKEHFVLVDAVGVSESKKMETGTLERKPSVPMKELMQGVTMGVRAPDTLTSLAGRLARFSKRLDDEQHREVRKITGGPDLNSIAAELLATDDPDALRRAAREAHQLPETAEPSPAQIETVREQRAKAATASITGPLTTYLEEVRQRQEQLVDEINPDEITISDWETDADTHRENLRQAFREWLEAHRDDIDALTIYYHQPHRRREITARAIRELRDALKREQPKLAPARVWDAYARLDQVPARRPESELAQIIALVRRVSGWDNKLTPYADTVRANFKRWVFGRHSGNQPKFNEEQMAWLEKIRDHIAASFHIGVEDLDYAPFDAEGGRGRMWQLFGENMESVLDQMNDEMAA